MADTINHQPLVTVGICCYNREEGFKHTLQCITNQTYKNLEIVISQDFNPQLDLTQVIAAKNDKRITFYKQQQKLTMYNNFLFLLEKANGEYFMWAADDDWWAPDFVEIIMNELIAYPESVAGHPDFIAVDEANNKITSYPDFLPMLQEFAVDSDIKRVTNFINQYEGFGKANLFYSIFKTSALRTAQVAALLKEGNLPCDMLIVLSVLLKGNIVIIPQMLRTCTTENVKHYGQIVQQNRRVNLGIAYINTGGISATHKKWGKYLYDHFKLINNSEFSFAKKVAIYPVIVKKILLFYFDVFCYNVQLRGYDIFSKFRRKYHLN